MQPDNRIRIVLQRKGRLAQGSQSLLQQCGIKAFPDKNQLFIQDDRYAVDVFFARDDDIPTFIDQGMCDLGIVGRNVLEEYSSRFNPSQSLGGGLQAICDLGFSKCQLSFAVPKEASFNRLVDLEGKTIATSYPNILKNYLANNQINANIIVMQGSVELAPKMKIADVIFDLVSTGTTLKENGLKKWVTVMESEAVLVMSKAQIKSDKNVGLNQLLSTINRVLCQYQNESYTTQAGLL